MQRNFIVIIIINRLYIDGQMQRHYWHFFRNIRDSLDHSFTLDPYNAEFLCPYQGGGNFKLAQKIFCIPGSSLLNFARVGSRSW